MVQSRLRCIVEWMPRVYGGSPGKPRSRSGSQCGKSAFVYSLRIGYPETVVNSACLSGLFSKVGCRVFFSQACSLEDGSRCTEEDSVGGAAWVVPLDSSLMLIAPGKDSNNRSKRLRVPCYSKGSRRARVAWLGVVKSLTEAQWHARESGEVPAWGRPVPAWHRGRVNSGESAEFTWRCTPSRSVPCDPRTADARPFRLELSHRRATRGGR